LPQGPGMVLPVPRLGSRLRPGMLLPEWPGLGLMRRVGGLLIGQLAEVESTVPRYSSGVMIFNSLRSWIWNSAPRRCGHVTTVRL